MSKSIINTDTKTDADAQATGTPWEFIHALEHRFGVPVDFDLAASAANAKAPAFFTEADNSLAQNWSTLERRVDTGSEWAKAGPARLAFLNPPFASIKPWAMKVADCSHLSRWTVMLVPHSRSCKWMHEQLLGRTIVDAIPRLQFLGHPTLYPKDLCLVVAGFGVVGGGYWDWPVDYGNWCASRVLALPKGWKPGLRADLYNSANPFTIL
jgi:phage N-6-adenine-methyltransferase